MDLKFGKKDAKKTSKKKTASEKASESNLGELSGWMQRMEQNVTSLEKRLDAVERRLSGEIFRNPKLIESEKGGSAASQNAEKELQAIRAEVQRDIAALRQELKSKGKSAVEKREKEPPETVVINMKRGAGKTGDDSFFGNDIVNIERRLEKLERRKATVTVGKIEVPVEITGIVGGVLALIIAALLYADYNKIVVSPPFVMTIGILLLAATILKTYLINVTKR